MVAEAEAQLAQAIASRDEDLRSLERQRALAKDGITTDQALTGARGGGRGVGRACQDRRKRRSPARARA